MYLPYGSYELKPAEVEDFGLAEVNIQADEFGNAIVLNTPDNGLLAGDRVRSRRNQYFDESRPEGPDNRRYTHWLTDDYNARQSVHMAEAQRVREVDNITGAIGVVATVTVAVARAIETGTDSRQLYSDALRTVSDELGRPFNVAKLQAQRQTEGSARLIKSEGQNVQKIVGRKLGAALGDLIERDVELDRVGDKNERRTTDLDQEARFDKSARNDLAQLSARVSAVSFAPRQFLYYAERRQTKPGVLTVNNAWYHRDDEDSLDHMVVAQDGFEPLYGVMMQIWNKLARTPIKRLAADPEATFKKFGTRLEGLIDFADLIRKGIGRDYGPLAEWQQDIARDAEEFLEHADFSKARKTAKLGRFVLRYRAAPGSSPPPQWYVDRPSIRDFSVQLPDNPLEGIPH